MELYKSSSLNYENFLSILFFMNCNFSLEALHPLQDINKINSTEPLLEALMSINENDVSVVPVIENGNCIGILNHKSITQFIFELQKLGALKR